MKNIVVAICLAYALIGQAFGQQYVGERFTATKGVTVSLNGGKLTVDASTTFSGNSLPGTLAPFASQMVPGTCYSIGPGGLAVSYTATVTYTLSALPTGTSATALRMYQVIGGEWTAVAGSTVDTSTFQVTGKLTSTATFAIFSGPPPTYDNEIYYYNSNGGGGDATLYSISLSYGKRSIANLGFGNWSQMQLSPQRNCLAMGRPNPNGTFDLYITSIDGSNPTLFAGGIANFGSGDAWSADGSTAYVSYVKPGSTAWNVYKIVIATGSVTLVHSGGSSWGPAGGGGTLAFADGQVITTITPAGVVKTFSSPAADGPVNSGLDVSNDGTKVIWATSDGSIYDATTAGASITRLLKSSTGNYGSNPHWSPDGTMFEYLWSGSGGQLAFYVALNNLANPTNLFGIPNPNILAWR